MRTSVLLSSSLLSLSLLFSPLTLASSNPDDPKGKSIYVVSPACDYYKCKVDWPRNSTQKISWLNAPKGDLKIRLESTGNGKTYTIVDKIGHTHNESSCHSYSDGESCGTTTWRVPSDIALGEYTVAVSSLNTSHIGYTDTVVIQKAKSKRGVEEMADRLLEARHKSKHSTEKEKEEEKKKKEEEEEKKKKKEEEDDKDCDDDEDDDEDDS